MSNAHSHSGQDVRDPALHSRLSHNVLALTAQLSPSVIALRSLRMEKTDDDKGDDDKGDGGKGDDDKGGGGDDGKGDKGPKPGSAEARVQGALDRAKKAEDALAERDRKDKEAEEKRLAEQGEFKTLAEQKAEEARLAKEELDKANGELKTAREEAESEVQAEIDKIKDPKKQETVKELLAGKNPFEQRRLLPKVLEMAGLSAPGRVGAGLPGDGTQGGTKIEEKEKEYRDLLTKSQKGEMTPSERVKLGVLGRELRALREAAASGGKSEGDSDEEVVLH